MVKRKLLLILVVFILTFFFFFCKDDSNNLKDDYYGSINSKIIIDKELDKEYAWSYFLDAQDKVDSDNREIIKRLLDEDTNDYLSDKEINVIKSIYNKLIDIDKRNVDDINILDNYLNMVFEVDSISELMEVIIKIENELNVDIVTNVEIMGDYKDNSHNIVYFVPVTFAFGVSSDYIINDDYMTYKAYIRRACVRLWKEYGKDNKEAREIIDRVFSFYEDVASYSKLSSELEDISSYYQVINESDFYNIYSNINDKYLEYKELDGEEIYSMVDKNQYKYLNDSLKIENLEVWKEVIVTKILSSYASYASSGYVSIVDDLNKSLFGELEDKSNYDRAIDLVRNIFSNEVDYIYESEMLTRDEKLEVEDMVNDIKNIYKKRLENNIWLSDLAKDKALIKLDEMKVIVGINNEVVNYKVSDNLNVSDDSLLQDIINIQKLFWKEELKRLEDDKKNNLISQSVVNAYYQPLDNSIVVPVSFFELISEFDNYYEKLGTMGMILAHEITHGFDGNGSQFDWKGNLSNWWNEEDRKEFNKLKDEVSRYYSKYEVMDGKYINGDKTVNENIADLGAIACISDLAIEKEFNDEEIKEMFSAFANIWSSYESSEYMQLLLLQDVHSPNKYRVNAVLSSNDLFYQVYDINFWNQMWLDKSERVSVW